MCVSVRVRARVRVGIPEDVRKVGQCPVRSERAAGAAGRNSIHKEGKREEREGKRRYIKRQITHAHLEKVDGLEHH